MRRSSIGLSTMANILLSAGTIASVPGLMLSTFPPVGRYNVLLAVWERGGGEGGDQANDADCPHQHL